MNLSLPDFAVNIQAPDTMGEISHKILILIHPLAHVYTDMLAISLYPGQEMRGVDDVVFVERLVEIERLDVFVGIFFEFEEPRLDLIDKFFAFEVDGFLMGTFFCFRYIGNG